MTADTPTPAAEAAGTTVRGERLVVFLGLAILLAGIGLTTTAIVYQRRQQTAATQERHLVDFRLVERSGKTVTQADLTNRYLVVGFLHTSCSLTCLEVSRRLSEVQTLLAGPDDVRLVSITVDPRTDTPELLSEFATKYGADPERWLFLTGEKAAVHRLVAASFLDRGTEGPDNPIPGGFLNTERIFLVDREGRVRRHFNGLKSGVAQEVIDGLAQLRAEDARR